MGGDGTIPICLRADPHSSRPSGAFPLYVSETPLAAMEARNDQRLFLPLHEPARFSYFSRIDPHTEERNTYPAVAARGRRVPREGDVCNTHRLDPPEPTDEFIPDEKDDAPGAIPRTR